MAKRPNILLITTDQQRFDTIHAGGNPNILTPHLDWLHDHGIHFTRCYTDSPICVAARVTIMTGRHGITNGLTSNAGNPRPMEQHPTLPGILTRAGYQTRAVGKMHFIPLRSNYGFEHMEILPDYYRYMARHPEFGRPMDHGMGQNEMDPAIQTVDETHSLTHWTVDRSVDFLETRDESRPFFMWTSFAKPHPPFDPCRSYWELYDRMDLPLPVYGDWSDDVANVPSGFMTPTWHLNNVHRYSEQRLRASKRAYYACISQIDYNLGILFSRLRELDLLENTWIIFTADHGEMLGDHHMGAKSVFLEGAGHVPMLIRPPGEAQVDAHRDTRCDRIACLADILPTCLNLAGVSAPSELEADGLDLLALAEGRIDRGILFAQCGSHYGALEGHYKYLFASHGGGELLFDLAKDPMEQHDLIRAGEALDVADRLRGKLAERLAQAGDHVSRDGKLVATRPAATERETHMGLWPGFHTRDFPCDVLH